LQRRAEARHNRRRMETDPGAAISGLTQVTRLLLEAKHGTAEAPSDLLPLVYEELRKLATHRMLGERKDHTLQATALVHEAYARLVGDNDLQWSNRAHFFAAAAEAMRRILIEHARAKHGPRRGGGQRKMPLQVADVVSLATSEDSDQILDLEDAISRLEKEDADAARVVRLRFYAGLTIEETASALGVSLRAVKQDWSFARVFLFRVLEDRTG
jgi:RNA polymerase sigma factor (TIGR02999 family)